MKVIKHYGIPKEATLADGKKVYRQDRLMVLEAGKKPRMVQCAPYDNHFIYETEQKNMSHYMCTCGSMAVLVGYNAYKDDASPTPTGELLVCYFHAQTGKHSSGDS